MFGTIFRFEIRYHLTRPVTYLYFAIFFLLAFGLVASDTISIVGSGGQLKRNAPWVIAQAMMILVAVGQVILTGLVGTAVLRDYQYRTHELLFTTPISRFAYLGGRFLGAFAVMVFVHLAIPLGLMIGGWMPWVDRTRLAPFDLGAYMVQFAVLVIPSVLILSAIFFAVGALTRNLFAIYTQGMVLLVAWSLANTLAADIDNKLIVGLLDPLGLQAMDVLTRYWTVVEKNTLRVPLEGAMLVNRLVWSVVAIGLFGMTYALFRFRSSPPTLGRRKQEIAATTVPPAPMAEAVPALPSTEGGAVASPEALSPQQTTAPVPCWIAQL